MPVIPNLPSTGIRIVNLSTVPMISIVDDDLSVREAMKTFVRSLGYEAAVFASAEEFFLSDRRLDSSCLITDVQMPGMGGIELYERMIASGHLTPVIFITAFPNERIHSLAKNAGVFGVLTKPFNAEYLIKCIHNAIAGTDVGHVKN